MDSIRRFSKPTLRRPRAVVAFEGWNDACDAASGALNYLLSLADANEPFAAIDPEEFFDFQAARPTVQVDEGGTRSLTWPTTKFFAAPRPDDSRDLLLVLGEEPSLRWKTFSRSRSLSSPMQFVSVVSARRKLLRGEHSSRRGTQAIASESYLPA